MAVDMDKLQEFLGRFVGDLGATFAAGNVVIGHRLGLYKALATSPARGRGRHPAGDCRRRIRPVPPRRRNAVQPGLRGAPVAHMRTRLSRPGTASRPGRPVGYSTLIQLSRSSRLMLSSSTGWSAAMWPRITPTT